MIKYLALGSILLLSTVSSLAFDNGQYKDVDPVIKDWFKSIMSPHGIPCCDISDGHLTIWRKSKNPKYQFEVPIDGVWHPVPPESIITNHSNPTGSAVVWYVRQGIDAYYIRCFVLEAQG